jgi:hypothetical protein
MVDQTYDPKKNALVYMRPAPKNRAIRHIESIEEAGIALDQEHCMAMFTSRSVPSVGPQGPPGEDANSKYDTIIASASDEFTPIGVGGPKTTFRSPYAMDLSSGYIRISLTNAPVGAAFIVDVTMNGSTMFSTPVQIDSGMKTSVGSVVTAVLAITDIPDDAEYLVYVTQVGSTVAGTGLKVAVTGMKVSP